MVVYKVLFPQNKKIRTNYTHVIRDEWTDLGIENNQIKFDNE